MAGEEKSSHLGHGPTVIKVVGIGGGGSNAVQRMMESGIAGVEFVAMNTDAQVLDRHPSKCKVQLGSKLTSGLGAGGDPEVGRVAAEESKADIRKALADANMVFLTAGMGGGTGTGAAPVVADLAREIGALTVAVVTRPFSFEGPRRSRLADQGVTSLMGRVDTIITISNDRLISVVEKKTTLVEAFRVADDVLRHGVQGISDIITLPGLLNVDFADVRAVMESAGPAIMGIGDGLGDHKGMQAAQTAVNSELLDQTIHGAKGLLVNITSGEDMTLAEVAEAMDYIRGLSDGDDAAIYFGHVISPEMKGAARITVLATGFQPRSSESVRAAEAAFSSTSAQSVAAARAELMRPANVAVANEQSNVMTGGPTRTASSRGSAADASEVFDESEFDIPTFLRDKQRSNG